MVCLWFTLISLSFAQAPDSGKKIEFEVASIHPAKDDGDHSSKSERGWYRTHNSTLRQLIGGAYDIDLRQVFGGPDWIDSAPFDINAKIPAELAEDWRENLLGMRQNLLADRFHLVIHREPREISGYELVVAKRGPKMERAQTGNTNPRTSLGRGQLQAENETMESLAKTLSRNREVGKLVIDKTGLTDRFNFKIEWSVDPVNDDRPSIFTALQDRLGLRLEPAKVPVLAIVVDHAEKPDGN